MIKKYASVLYPMSKLQLFTECLNLFEQLQNECSDERKELDSSLTIAVECDDDGWLHKPMHPNQIKHALCETFPDLVAVLHPQIQELGLFNVVLVRQESPTTLTKYNARLWIVPT
jgi:hypothetical protein